MGGTLWSQAARGPGMCGQGIEEEMALILEVRKPQAIPGRALASRDERG